MSNCLMGVKLMIIDVSVFCVPIIEAFSMSFHDFLETFIRKVLITDSVLSSIGDFELMVFQNRIDQLYFPKQQQTNQNILRDYMISKSIDVIENNDLFTVTLFLTKNQISQCFDIKTKTKNF